MGKRALASILLVSGIVLCFVEPYIISVMSGVPYWFLAPVIYPLSGVPLERKMTVEVTPTTPTELGETIHVMVFDTLNGTPIDGAKVEVSKDGSAVFKTHTQLDGTAQFEFPGATTVIAVSKEKYKAVMKVIPKIPDEWVRTFNIQRVTWTVTLLASLIPAGLLFYKSRQE